VIRVVAVLLRDLYAGVVALLEALSVFGRQALAAPPVAVRCAQVLRDVADAGDGSVLRWHKIVCLALDEIGLAPKSEPTTPLELPDHQLLLPLEAIALLGNPQSRERFPQQVLPQQLERLDLELV